MEKGPMNIGNESEFLENKESLSQLDKGIKSLTAMLNKHFTGTLYLGVYDDGEVKGLQLGKRSLDDIRERIATLVQPKFAYEVEELKDEKNNVYLKIQANGNDIPYSCDGRFYIRNVKSDDLMDNQSIRRAIVSGSFDALRESKSNNQNLSFSYLKEYFVINGIHYREGKDFLGNFGLLNSKKEYNLVAYLLSDNNAVSIKVVRFNGIDKTAMSERNEFGNRSLLSACRMALEYIKSMDVTKVELKGGFREEKHLFNIEAFREAWINAVVHNDWLHMLPPSIFVYDDRIEVSSYGQPPFDMTLDEFFSGRSKPVNESLFNVFSLSDFAEQSGHGIPTIVSNYTKKAFNFDSNMIVVTIPFAFTPESVIFRKKVEEGSAKLIESHRNVLSYLLDNPKSTLSEAANACNLSVGGIKKIVSSLKEKGLLRRKGDKRNGEWTR